MTKKSPEFSLQDLSHEDIMQRATALENLAQLLSGIEMQYEQGLITREQRIEYLRLTNDPYFNLLANLE